MTEIERLEKELQLRRQIQGAVSDAAAHRKLLEQSEADLAKYEAELTTLIRPPAPVLAPKPRTRLESLAGARFVMKLKWLKNGHLFTVPYPRLASEVPPEVAQQKTTTRLCSSVNLRPLAEGFDVMHDADTLIGVSSLVQVETLERNLRLYREALPECTFVLDVATALADATSVLGVNVMDVVAAMRRLKELR